MKFGFGVDLGGTTVKIAYFNEEGTLMDKWEIPTITENSGSRILPDIADSIRSFLTRQGTPDSQIMGIGIGAPGPVDGQGNVNMCVNLGWGTFNLKHDLEQLTGLPVCAGNDASVAALGEYWKGGGAGFQSLVMVTLGTGVGGGIILDGKLLHGCTGSAGEIGHMCINREETETCGCGKRGCVEQYCSATGIVRLAGRYLSSHQTPSCLREAKNLTCKDIFDAAKADDQPAGEILEQVYEYLGEFLANICCVINPQAVVLGGGVSHAGDILLEGTRRHFKKNVFCGAGDVQFRLATLGNDAGAYGAFKLILDEYKNSNPT